MNASSWAVRQGRELEVTASSVLFIPPGGSTCTPPDSNSPTASAHGRLPPATAQAAPGVTLFIRRRSAECFYFPCSLMPPHLPGVCFFNACTHLHPHTRKTSHPSKYIFSPVFNLFVCDGVSKKLVLQSIHNSLRLVSCYIINK